MRRVIKYIAILLIPLLQAFQCITEDRFVYDMFWVIKNDTNYKIYVSDGLVYITDMQDNLAGHGNTVIELSPQEEATFFSSKSDWAQNREFNYYIDNTMDMCSMMGISKDSGLTKEDWSFWIAIAPDGDAINRWRYGDREKEERSFFNETSWEYIYNSMEQTHMWVFHILPEDLQTPE